MEKYLSRVICIPTEINRYKIEVDDSIKFRKMLDILIDKYPQLFPKKIIGNYLMKDKYYSKRLSIVIRRIKVCGISFTIRPSFVMPYMTGFTIDVEDGLYLIKNSTSFDDISYVFGRNAMYWLRLVKSIGRHSIVDTTIQKPKRIPANIVVDEKYSWIRKNKIYIPTTVGGDCFLGVTISMNANKMALTRPYGEFKTEALAINSKYGPKSITNDGWPATVNSLSLLFPLSTLITCFLHVYIKIRKVSKKKLKKSIYLSLVSFGMRIKQPQKGHFLNELEDYTSIVYHI